MEYFNCYLMHFCNTFDDNNCSVSSGFVRFRSVLWKRATGYLQQIPYVCGIHIRFSLLRDPGITKSSISYPENGKPPGIDPFGYPKMAKDMKDNERQIERTGRKTRKTMNFLLHFSQWRLMYSNVSVFCSAWMKDIIKANLYRKRKTEVLNDTDTRNKNTWCLVLGNVVALQGPVLAEMVKLLLSGSFSACALSLAWLSGNVQPCWHISLICSWSTQLESTAWRRTCCAYSR